MFGAHLDAYVTTLPVIYQLRLCNRFGKGPESYVTKLPVELVTKIESGILHAAKEEAVPRWDVALRCFEQRCTFEEHLIEQEKVDLYRKKHPEAANDMPPSGRELDEKLPDLAWYGNVHRSHIHRMGTWEREWVGHPGTFNHAFINWHRELFRNHFGLDIWWTTIRLDAQRSNKNDVGASLLDYEPTQTTAVYLVVPDTKAHSHFWGLSEAESEGGMDDCSHGYGVEVKCIEHAGTTRKFARALQILDLKPYVHLGHDGPELFALSTATESNDKAETRDNISSSWPQLTLLSRSAV